MDRVRTVRAKHGRSGWLPLVLAVFCLATLGSAPAARAQQQAAQSGALADQIAAARAESAAHRYGSAIDLYRRILAAQPDQLDALAEISDTLEASGRWMEAVPQLEHFVALQPNDARRVFQLGRMKSWRADTRADGIVLLLRATQLDPQRPEFLAGYAEVLSWDPATRNQAGPLFERALAIDAHNEAALVPYAEMLSWSAPTRPRAAQLFGQTLAQNPRNARALVGRGQLESWTGHSREALTDYDATLALDPANAPALRGKAEILNWQGQHLEARDLLDRAQVSDHGNPKTLVELARANAGLGRYRDALALLDQIPSTGFPEAGEIRSDITRGQAVYTELGFSLRHSSSGINPYRLETAVSTPVGGANRITLFYRPTWYQATDQPPSQRDFNSNYFGLILDSELSDRLSTRAELGGETYPGAPSSIDGALEARYALRPSLRVVAGFRRQSVDDTLVSARGDDFSGVFIGQVRSNLASAGLQYGNVAHRYDVSFTYTDGVYTGSNLDSNRRWGFDGSIGRTFHGDHPYFRLAYNFAYLSFAYDENFQPGGPMPNRRSGGYFSPTEFLVNSGMARIDYRWGRFFEWYAEGSLGAQNVETTFTRFGDAQLASTFATGFFWRPAERDEIRGGYEYLDIFNAFRRNIFRIAWRHYF